MRVWISALLAVAVAACAPENPPAPAPSAGRPAAPPPPAPARPPGPGDAGGAAPPIPADNPAWSRNSPDFVPSPQFYGEKDWHDVRMRVFGHIAALEQDAAARAAAGGDPRAAAAHLRDLIAVLDAAPAPPAGPAADSLRLLRAAALREAAWMDARAAGTAPPPHPSPGLAAFRAQWAGLVVARAAGAEVAAPAEALAAAVRAWAAPRDDLDIHAFGDFTQRHRLRILLLEAALDARDPDDPARPWGHWTDAERRAAAAGLAAAAEALARGQAPVGAAPGASPWSWPAAATAAARPAPGGFSAEGLGALPTGDTLIDVGGFPGPAAIGRLERLSLEDPAHRARLEALAATLDAALAEDPSRADAALAAFEAEMDALPHGSRYYNVKQARNEGVRVFARRGAVGAALTTLRRSWPLHHQDFACPNREGILRVLEARLLALNGDAAGARAAADAGRAAARDFLAAVDRAAAAPGGRPAGPGAPPR